MSFNETAYQKELAILASKIEAREEIDVTEDFNVDEWRENQEGLFDAYVSAFVSNVTSDSRWCAEYEDNGYQLSRYEDTHGKYWELVSQQSNDTYKLVPVN